LTIAAQAFLLQVITNRSIDATARAVILAAGVVASFAALIALLRLRQREVYYSDAIAHYGKGISAGDPRPHLDLKGQPLEDSRGLWGWLDRAILRPLAGWSKWPGIHIWWALALALFIVADIVAFYATNDP
jgi:hypothetical protein